MSCAVDKQRFLDGYCADLMCISWGFSVLSINYNYYCFDLIKLHEVHTLVHMEDRAVVDGIEKYGGWSLVVVGSLSYSYFERFNIHL